MCSTANTSPFGECMSEVNMLRKKWQVVRLYPSGKKEIVQTFRNESDAYTCHHALTHEALKVHSGTRYAVERIRR
jgi:hypothetical protein